MKKELIQLLKGKNAYIQTHDFPDPDALATAFALQEYLKYYGIEATICYEGKLERASAIRRTDQVSIAGRCLRGTGGFSESEFQCDRYRWAEVCVY